MPHVLIGPIIIRVGPVDHRIERRIILLAREDVLDFLVLLIANRMRISSGGGDQEIQRLGACVARTLGHDVEQGSVGLGVKLVEDHAGDVEPVLEVGLCGEDLVEGVGGLVDDSLLRREDLHPLRQGW